MCKKILAIICSTTRCNIKTANQCINIGVYEFSNQLYLETDLIFISNNSPLGQANTSTKPSFVSTSLVSCNLFKDLKNTSISQILSVGSTRWRKTPPPTITSGFLKGNSDSQQQRNLQHHHSVILILECCQNKHRMFY